MAGGELFKSTYAFNDRIGGCERVQVITCACGQTNLVRDQTNRGTGFNAAAAEFRRRGWRVSGKRSGDQCPDCRAGRPRPGPKPKGSKMNTTHAAPGVGVSADPPRQPNRDDWKRIREALDVDYDEKAGGYREALTDRAVAERLHMPRAWIAEERERRGPERCEADGQDLSELRQVVVLAAEASAKHLELAASTENLGKTAQRLIDRLAARGVA